MLEGQLLEGPGTYQGGQKGQQTVDKKSLQKRKANMKRDRQVLNTSTDILNRVFSDDESLPTPRQPKEREEDGEYQQLLVVWLTTQLPMLVRLQSVDEETFSFRSYV